MDETDINCERTFVYPRVKFAVPLVTSVHYIPGKFDEDRFGTWHHFALDRDRFKRRVELFEHTHGSILLKSYKEHCLSSAQS